MRVLALLAGALAVTTVSSHPGHDHEAEMLQRNAALKYSARSLTHCASKIKARGLEARNVARRSQLASHLLKRANVEGRDLTSLLNVSHHSSQSYTLQTAESTIFATNNSCVLSPEVTEGPYYVAGEYVRSNVTEGQAGVELAFDIQIVDVNTCEPVPNAYIEIWHANSTGVYSGVSAAGNGNSANDNSNLKATFLRGVQRSDTDGSVQFHTLVPGHYTGRTPHIHIMVHLNASARANGTLVDTVAAHAGQAFFDQSLLTSVGAISPYSKNTQGLTLNSADSILRQEAASSDPFVEYVLLGNQLSDGLLGWLSFGINTTYTRTVSAAATLYEGGGVANANSGMGGGGGPGGGAGGPNGTMSGAPGGTGAPSGSGTQTGTPTASGSSTTTSASTTIGATQSTSGANRRRSILGWL